MTVQYTTTPGFDVPDAEDLAKAHKAVSSGKKESTYDAVRRRLNKGLIESKDLFVQVPISDEDEAAIDEWVGKQDLSRWHAIVGEFADLGLIVSVRTAKGGGYSCTLSDELRMEANERSRLSAFAADLPTAVFVVAYKHRVMLQGDWDKATGFKPTQRKYR